MDPTTRPGVYPYSVNTRSEVGGKRMNSRGVTLLELAAAVAIFSIVMAVLYTIAIGFVNASEMQDVMITTNDEVRRAMLVIVPRIRQAARNSINWGNLPGDNITFRMADDVDGNGFAVDQSGRLELSAPITIQRDVNDANGDGITMAQLVMIQGGEVRVLANRVMEGVAAGGGIVPPAGVGFWVAPRNGGLDITIRANDRTVRGMQFNTTMTEFIMPRN